MPTEYKLKAIHVRRLRKLIAFLDKLPRKRFNFAIVRNEPPKCGAVGCAIGYMPNVFPKVFQSVVNPNHSKVGAMEGWDWTHNVTFKDRYCDFPDVAAWVSGLESYQASGLFHPDGQSRVHPKLKDLPESATPKQVARMLEKFIQLHT
jgi:hypothetical protein